MEKVKRKNIPKKLRFEVFKRDSFTCQYCGRKAPDAFICGNDHTAARLLQTLGAIGKQVPRDVLLAGFDDVACAQLLSPPLTTMRQPCEEIAAVARPYCADVRVCATAAEGAALAVSLAQEDDVLVASGSMYLLSGAKKGFTAE